MNKAKFNHDFFKTIFVFALFILSACNSNNAETPTVALTVPPISKTPVPTLTVTPSPTATPAFEEFGLSTELVKALKAHIGLELSINKETGGQYTVTATMLSSTAQPITQSVYVIPSTLSEDLTSKNRFGNTPTIQTVDRGKLYWVEEKQGWFEVEISPDINKPVFVSFDQRVVATRVIIAEFNQPFSQEALNRWNEYPSLLLGFQLLSVNAITGENTRFGYIENRSMGQSGLTSTNSGVQIISAWCTTTLFDGTSFQFFPTKWLDPMDGQNPKGDEWKIIFAASGQEIMGDQNNREKFDDLLTQAATPGTRMMVYPIIAVDDNFFNSTNSLITFGAAQPSLIKLFEQPNNSINSLKIPNLPDETFGIWIERDFNKLNSSLQSIGFGFETNQDPTYKKNFFPSEFQTIIFPSMIILR